MESYTYLENNIIYLPVSKILPNPYQPRRSYNRQAIEELAASIKQYGVLQPVTVRYINNKIYELVNGERRLKAAQTAGFDTIPAMIINANDREAAAMGLAENLQRENLGYLEEAESMRVLKYGFKYSVNDISHIINKDKKYIEENLSFLTFSKKVRALLIYHNISREMAKMLLRIEDEKTQIEIIEKAVQYNLNLRGFEELVEGYIRQKKINNSVELNHLSLRSKFKDIRHFNNVLKQAVAIMQSAGMETSYEISKNDEDYEIKISIKP